MSTPAADCASAFDTSTCLAIASRLQGQAEKLDLIWWGSWAVVGLLLTALVANHFYRVFRVTHGW